ncbi:unnamed protein product [Menidia menidia]|uniref:(Atlantic silverside) hypothetical protein n=1 Tax=Menidia menidia TaxID=238744 RepID=A0A8S4AC26_9TELE|nr:unnamed protein product [Menidia menidia]
MDDRPDVIDEVAHYKKGDTEIVWKPVPATTVDNLKYYEISGQQLEPSTTYMVRVRRFSSLSSKYSDSSEEFEFTTHLSYQQRNAEPQSISSAEDTSSFSISSGSITTTSSELDSENPFSGFAASESRPFLVVVNDYQPIESLKQPSEIPPLEETSKNQKKGSEKYQEDWIIKCPQGSFNPFPQGFGIPIQTEALHAGHPSIGSMQQLGRQRLRPWLEEQIQSGRYPGVSWLDQSARIFQIPWTHAARHGWSIDRDATLFRSWAMHTGRYRPGKDKPDPKTWKANFRCALNSLPDVCELPEHSRKRGSNAYRVYRMLPSSQTRKRRKGLQFLNKPQERRSVGECPHDEAFPMHTWQPATTRSISDTLLKVENGAQNAFSCNQAHGTGDDNPYLPHNENHSDVFGPNYIRELSEWSTHQQTLMS